jgi:ABC-type nitrate/sulfonate/bicarbonate transport system substrate-binding protein
VRRSSFGMLLLILGASLSIAAVSHVAPGRSYADSPAPQVAAVRLGVPWSDARMAAVEGLDDGWFEEEGLVVESQLLPGSMEVLLALAGGAIDVGQAGVVPQLRLAQDGVDIRAIAGGTTERRGRPIHGLLVSGNSSVQRPADLAGKAIGVSGTDPGDRLAVQAWLQQQGVEPAAVTVGELPDGQAVAALLSGRVDAVSAVEPFLSIGVEHGARVLAHHYTDLNASTVLSQYVATGGWLSRNGDVARRFARAVHRAHAALEADPARRRQAAAERLGITDELSERIRHPDLQTSVDRDGIAWWLDVGRRLGGMQRPLSARDLVFDSAP